MSVSTKKKLVKLSRLIISQEKDQNRDRQFGFSIREERDESIQALHFQRAGGGRRILRKKLGAE